jgi:mRNA-degrading endonuclease RelE of RelBE toxin-antitoxin system
MPSERYEVVPTRQAEKDLKDLRGRAADVIRALLQLEDDPYKGHPLTGSLRGARSLEFNLRGSGAYRAVYVVLDDERVCLVFIIGPHENIYRMATRRYDALKRSGDFN